MSHKLLFEPEKSELPSVSAFREMGAYEALWSGKGMSFKKLAEMRRSPESVLSDFVDEATAYDFADRVRGLLADAGIDKFGVRVYGTWEYPEGLHDVAHPLELLYFQGSWDLVYTRSVSVVCTRNPSAKGKARTCRLVRNLVKDGFHHNFRPSCGD